MKMEVDMAVIETATEIRPFNVDIPEEELAEMRRRIAATRWPTKELVEDRSQGVQLATLKELARYWETDYDWRKAEAKLNALAHFTTEIIGVTPMSATPQLVELEDRESGRIRRVPYGDLQPFEEPDKSLRDDEREGDL
jgi:hypothetical protein